MLVCKWFANTEEAQLYTYILKTNIQTNKKYKKKKPTHQPGNHYEECLLCPTTV